MMRYSEIPRDFSSDSVRYTEINNGDRYYKTMRDDSPPSDVSIHSSSAFPLISPTSVKNGLTGKSNGQYVKYQESKDLTRRRKNSAGAIAAAICSVTNINSNGCNQQSLTSNPPCKTQSLPTNSTMTSLEELDDVILSALRVSPEDLAGQITLLDFPPFAAIQPDELTSCAWTKKNKHTLAPNVVAFTRRFNHTSFWTVQEILNGQTPKHRAEILGHFIKVCKKLYEHNNLHSLFAIVSAMQSASVYRLTKTWSYLSKKEKQMFDRLADIFNDKDNWSNLRVHLESLKLPCIPYLGLFLTDLVYIDLRFPHCGGLESEQRRTQMNNILRVISNYQGSDYSYVSENRRVKKYLQSFRYIEELQNLFESDQYQKSLLLEPPSTQSTSSCSSKESVTPNIHHLDPSALASLNLSPAKTSGSMRLTSSAAAKFIPGHRKCRSLGSKFRSTSLPRNFHQNCTTNCSIQIANASNATSSHTTKPSIGNAGTGTRQCSGGCKCRIFSKISPQIVPLNEMNHMPQHPRHLLDDSVLEDSKMLSDVISTDSSDAVLAADGELDGKMQELLSFQGCVRRKTVLKDGRKPAVASWQRYWIQIWANSLVYFPPKSFKGSERSDFKKEPCKVCCLDGWTAQLMDNPQQVNTFKLGNNEIGTVYKFRTGSPRLTERWLDAFHYTAQYHSQFGTECKKTSELPSINLMTFE